MKLAPAAIVDAGCGTGEAQRELALRYPKARRVALDLALPMLAAARDRVRARGSPLTRLAGFVRGAREPPPPDWVCGDIAALPFAPGAFDLVWSNLALQWINDLPRAIKEFRRVLKVGGLASFTTFGPDTLKELRAAFADVDRHTHVSRFVDMHDIGDLLVEAGFADPVMDMEYVTLTYTDGAALMRDLRAIGATNATIGRPRGLMGRERWRRTLAALDGMRRDGRIPATFEVIYGHAWKVAPKETAEGTADRPVRAPAARVGGGEASVMTRGIFVTGTDTGVGKTRVAVALLRGLAADGVRAIGMKPVAAGILPGEARNADVTALIDAAGVAADVADINPYSYPQPIAPHLAAARQGTGIDMGIIAAAYARLAARSAAVVVEGAGGALTPLSERTDMLDIAARLGLPVLLVVGVRLGCLNHALLTAQAIRARGLELVGWVANRIDPAMPEAAANVATLARMLAAPLIADLAWRTGADDAAGIRGAALAALRLTG